MTEAPALRSKLIVGIAARMRESSVTRPSARGTLKSTRTKTRLAATAASRILSLSIGVARSDGDGQASRDERDQVSHTAAVSPLVVVPRDDLDHRPAQDHGRRGVDDRAPAVALEVHRDERLVGDAEDALHRAGLRRAEGVVELLDRGRAADIRSEVDDADGRGRDAQAEPVELALEVRDDERERLRRTCRRRDDFLSGAPGAARVAMGDVEDV